MCWVSMIYDNYKDKFPQPLQPSPWAPTIPTVPAPYTPQILPSAIELQQWRDLIKEFREAVELARKLDIVTHQPDCEDLEKKKLEDRVAELERQLDVIRDAAKPKEQACSSAS